MTPFFEYLLKSSVSLAIFFILFKLVMSNDKSFQLNRFLLLGILFVSVLIPFIQISFFREETVIKPVEFVREVFVPVNQPVEFSVSTPEITSMSQNAEIQINPWLTFYSIVILLLLVRLTVSVIRIFQLYKRSEKIGFSQFVLAIVKDFIQPFSFLKHIFIAEKDYDSNKDILIAHEAEHIKQKHYIDLFLVEIFTLFYWFNPFMWLLRRELKLTHEYLADRAVLQKGIDAKKYQLLVLEKAVGERRFAMANHFAQKPILKRMKMMKKNKITRWNGLKILLFIPVIVFLLQAFTRPELIRKTEEILPSVFQKNEIEKWLEIWNSENMGKGFFDPDIEPEDSPKTANNILVILMNAKDEYLVEGQYHTEAEIKPIVKDFLYGKNPDGKKAPDYLEEQIPGIGKLKVSKGVISYKHDLASSPEMVNSTLRAIGAACLEVRKEKAQIFFEKDYFDLDEQKQQAVDVAVPVWFFYESPQPPTPSTWLPFERKPSPDPKPINIVMNNDGSITVGNHKYGSFNEFVGHLEEWRARLDKFNKEKRSKGFYRANLIVEPDVPEADYKKIFGLFYREEIHVEHITWKAHPQKYSLESEKLKAREDQLLVKSEKLNLQNDSIKISFEEEQKRAKTDKFLFQKVKLDYSEQAFGEPPSFISVTLEKDRNIICQSKNFNYDEFEVFLKKTYKGFKRKLDLTAEVKWDTAVGYQGIHKLAKILDKSGFDDEDIKFLPYGMNDSVWPTERKQ